MNTNENLAYSLGVQAYIYGYPLLIMDRAKQLTAPSISQEWLLLNKFKNIPYLVDPGVKLVVIKQ